VGVDHPTKASGHIPRVAVLGAGAAGTIAAVHLLRAAGPRPLELELVDRAGSFGTGTAYATADPLYLLNVPAVRMGAISGQPEHFHGWCHARGEQVGEADYLPRGLFGTYLGQLLDEAERDAPLARVHRRRDEALDMRRSASFLEVELRSGAQIDAHAVVLALGPLPGADPIVVADELRDSGVYVPDPWAEGALDKARADSSVLLIGTGLTMVDVAISLAERPGGPRVRAISRHGLLPRPHRRELTRVEPFELPGSEGLEAIFAAVATELERARAQGRAWRDVIDSARAGTPEAWRRLPLADRRRFLSEVNRYWDVHRFRIAPAVAERLDRHAAAGRVSWGAGGIEAIEPRGDGALVALRDPGSGELETVAVDRVINCTGAGTAVADSPSLLLRSLLGEGFVRPDPLGLGLDVDRCGLAVDADGRPDPRLSVIGSLRRGVEWESIGVTEFRDQAARIAGRIIGGAPPAA
jgi:uncharacterized NAD(P)/FAD-binding protein YdhS